nr:MAG TPA: hypothetical protein [Caudoviricetes sp.]DAZ51333.1 MAG TPA: hypothetical protein [Caudoviricetes sp.]
MSLGKGVWINGSFFAHSTFPEKIRPLAVTMQ